MTSGKGPVPAGRRTAAYTSPEGPDPDGGHVPRSHHCTSRTVRTAAGGSIDSHRTPVADLIGASEGAVEGVAEGTAAAALGETAGFETVGVGADPPEQAIATVMTVTTDHLAERTA